MAESEVKLRRLAAGEKGLTELLNVALRGDIEGESATTDAV